MTTPPTALEQAFLDDIVAHPDEPSLWLILADWLEDRADPRAELVRRTWSLQYEPDHADFATRQARVQALLAGGMVPVRPRRMLGGIEFAWIPPGTFLMGSPETEAERRENERHQRVTLPVGYWLGVHPITQGQWQEVLGDNPSHFSRGGSGRHQVERIGDAALALFPVDSVSWIKATEFCTRLSQVVGQQVCLPTEKQWEYACRASSTTPFHFGPILNGLQANCDGNYPYGTRKKGPLLARTSMVGWYPPNAWGLCDMHGNVREWCQDGHPHASVDPRWEDHHALRGGSWIDDPHYCRSAYRSDLAHGSHADKMIGFRVAMALP